MTSFVQQRNDHDCVIACLAMWMDRDYDEIAKAVLRVNEGVCLWDAVSYMRVNGIPARRSSWWFHSHKAILDVPSLNFVGGMHAIYWDGERLFDPNKGRAGRIEWTSELLDAKPSWGGTITEVPIDDEPRLIEVSNA
jgi:hypothetical protein